MANTPPESVLSLTKAVHLYLVGDCYGIGQIDYAKLLKSISDFLDL